MGKLNRWITERYRDMPLYIQRKVAYFTVLFFVTSLYIGVTVGLFLSWYNCPSEPLAIMGLIIISGLFLILKHPILSELTLFFAGLSVILASIHQYEHFQFYGNTVMFIFITIIVYIESWQKYVVYLSVLIMLFYRLNAVYLLRLTNPVAQNIFEQSLFITISILTLMLLAFYMDAMIQREINEKKRLTLSLDVDILTHVFTRNRFELDLSHQINSAYEIAIIDIDLFKTVNDLYGHDKGDQVLTKLCEIMRLSFRLPDFNIYRWGGEEFLIIGHHCSAASFDDRLNVFREYIETYDFDDQCHITVSIGTSSVQETDNFYSLFQECDQALYRAKVTGRNRLIRAEVKA